MLFTTGWIFLNQHNKKEQYLICHSEEEETTCRAGAIHSLKIEQKHKSHSYKEFEETDTEDYKYLPGHKVVDVGPFYLFLLMFGLGPEKEQD